MSRSDRKAVKILVLIIYMCEQKFIISDRLNQIALDGIDAYQGDLNDKEFSEVLGYYDKISEAMAQLKDKVNQIRLLSFLANIAEEFRMHLRSETKHKAWTQIAELCHNEIPKNFINFIDEIDLAEEISERILNAAG